MRWRKTEECPTPDKHTYYSKKVAKKAAQAVGRKKHVYRCKCGFWHLTSMDYTTARIVKELKDAREAT